MRYAKTSSRDRHRRSSSSESGNNSSSASIQNIQSPLAWLKQKFRASEKSSHQVKWLTLAFRSLASSTVPSVEPVSVRMISGASGSTEHRTRFRFFCSFLKMRQTLRSTFVPAYSLGRRRGKTSIPAAPNKIMLIGSGTISAST